MSLMPQAARPLSVGRVSVSAWPSPLQWFLFVLQVLLVEIIDALSDVFRGNIRPASAGPAIQHALAIIRFEKQHGFFWEPVWQIFFRHDHTVLGFTFTRQVIIDIANNVYAWLHIGMPLAVAAWVFARHREWFPLLRNTIIASTVLAGIFYQIYTVAPPRLTTGVTFHGLPYRFVPTMQQNLGGPQWNGHPLAVNPYAAMPSIHVSWALIVSITVIVLSPSIFRFLMVLYPGIILFAVVITSNHYFLDAIGAIPTVIAALFLATAVQLFSTHRGKTSGTRLSYLT
ncbi:MAG: phosphatase PAP2 family protein [Chloroflexota bacterium]